VSDLDAGPGEQVDSSSTEALCRLLADLERDNARLRFELEEPAVPSSAPPSRRWIYFLAAALALIAFGVGYYEGSHLLCGWGTPIC
jgi:hypothetical protein